MIEDHLELYERIHDSLAKHYQILTDEDAKFVAEIATHATLGALEYVNDLEEALVHLRDSVRRMGKVN